MAVAVLNDFKLVTGGPFACEIDDIVLKYQMLKESFGSIVISSKGVFLSIEQSIPQSLNQSDYKKELLEALAKQRLFSDGTSFSDHFGKNTKIEMTNLEYNADEKCLKARIEWPAVYYGSKIWDYEMIFNSDFSKIIDGSVREYDEDHSLLKMDPFIDMDDDQCYELHITERVRTRLLHQSLPQMAKFPSKNFHQFPKNTLPSTPPSDDLYI